MVRNYGRYCNNKFHLFNKYSKLHLFNKYSKLLIYLIT